jgi:hypothetical protein
LPRQAEACAVWTHSRLNISSDKYGYDSTVVIKMPEEYSMPCIPYSNIAVLKFAFKTVYLSKIQTTPSVVKVVILKNLFSSLN